MALMNVLAVPTQICTSSVKRFQKLQTKFETLMDDIFGNHART